MADNEAPAAASLRPSRKRHLAAQALAERNPTYASSSLTSFVAVKVHWTKASGHQRAGCTATFKLRATGITGRKMLFINLFGQRNEATFAPAFLRILGMQPKI
jgi:hypothetical protein